MQVKATILTVAKRVLNIRVVILLALLNIIRKLHSKTTKPLHESLGTKFRWYAEWWEWEYHRHVHIAGGILAGLTVIMVIVAQLHSAFALSTWTQSDWSGGVGSSTSNQYNSASSLNTLTSDNITLETQPNWLNSAWAYRKEVTFNNTSANIGVTPDTLTNFPILIHLDSQNFNFAEAQSAGQDIRFTTLDGVTPLNYQIENWNASAQVANIWVDAPSIGANTTNQGVYMYWGNPSASDGQNATAVWNSSYLGVYHLANGSTLSTNDSTANNNNGTNNGVSATSGPIAGGGDFNGSSYITTPLFQNSVTTYTISSWVRTTTAGGVMVQDRGSSGSGMSITFAIGANGAGFGTAGVPNCGIDSNATYVGGTINADINDGNWHYVTCVFSSISGQTITPADFSIYVDGVAKSLASTDDIGNPVSPVTGSGGTLIGYHPAWGSYYSGSLAEVRISDVARTAGWIAANYKNETNQFASYGTQETEYPSSGTLTSNIFNTGLPEDYGNLTYTATVPSGTTVAVYVRSGNQANLSDAPAWTSCNPIASGGVILSTCTPNGTQYVQYKLVFTSDGSATPDFTNIQIMYSPTDTTPPATNASNVTASNGNGGTNIASNGWANTDPYFSWTAATDHPGGSGIAGYCLYLGDSSSGNPVTSSGDLGGTSPLNTGGACPFAVPATHIDTSISGYLTTPLTSSTSPYYLNVVAITGADYVWTGSPAQFEFYFDNTSPSNPAFISAPSEFVSSDNVTLTWPTTGSDAASDSVSGIAGLQYKIGANGTWYGANHSGAQNCTDLLPNNGSYTMNPTYDYPNLVQGNNIVYFRTYNNACDVSTADITTVIKINSTAPSAPQNLAANPTTNTANSFSFSWLSPATFQGSANNITYCYTVNTLPTSSNCTFTAAGATSLPAGAYATQPGDNTLYLVAKDEAGNINYATYAYTTFTANTPAPGIPLALDIADVSVRATSSWKLAISWNPPIDVGAGIAKYKIYRSTDRVHYALVATTAGESFVDTNLNQQTYYYKIEACDSANNCGAFTAPVSLLPTGKYTSPANLISGPEVTVTTRTATINWVTDRASNSGVEYGLASNHYYPTQAYNLNQVVSHSVTLDNLQAGTTYYYRSLWTDVDGNTGTSSEYVFTTLPAPTVSDVKVSGINLYNATITFTTQNATAVELQYGNSSQTVNTSTNTSTYSIPLNGLTPGTTYTFKLNPYDTSGYIYVFASSYSFTTPPKPIVSNVQFSPVTGALTGTEQVNWATNVPATSQIAYELPGGTPEYQLNTTLATSHNMTISNLTYNTLYDLTATSVDGLGNTANSNLQVFKTGTDTRPPRFSDLTIQPSIVGSGASATGQLVVSWKTDKASTSQVAYGEGTSSGFTAKTAVNTALVTNHVVIVSGLSTSEVYHIQAISADAYGITGQSNSQTTIIGQANDSALSIVFNALQAVFGL